MTKRATDPKATKWFDKKAAACTNAVVYPNGTFVQRIALLADDQMIVNGLVQYTVTDTVADGMRTLQDKKGRTVQVADSLYQTMKGLLGC